MSDNAWKEIDRLLNQALDRPPPERRAFLREACGSDAALFAEVESLLGHAEADSGVLAGLVFAPGDRDRGMSLLGRRLGPYAVQELLGAGGMGEVYRARDARLGREVAIKILPDGFGRDPERRARFDREARLLAALNHQHIAAIYGVEDCDGTPALVLEYVAGETIAERLARGPLPIGDALRVATQVVDALDVAHERGIVHRDLKPANIKITPDGTVKVLDFGLAKATLEGDADVRLTHSPTVTMGATAAGMILGTPAYMSPEQARGWPTDKRTDVWAFGCVLYELLTGRPAFGGETLPDTIVAILEREPDWSALPPATPASVRRLLRRCLDRDVKRRLRDIGDARTDLEEALAGRDGGSPAPSAAVPAPATVGTAPFARGVRDRALLLGATVVAIALAAFVFAPRRALPEQMPQHEITPPRGYAFAPLWEGGPIALSPDGRQIAFVASGTTGTSLWVRSVDAFDARELTGTEGAAAPFWSPDGDAVAFVADGKLKTVALTGGAPTELVTGLRSSSQGATPGDWDRNGRLAYSRSGSMWTVPSKGGEPTQISTLDTLALDENHLSLEFLPDGRHYLMLVRGGVELRLELVAGEIGSSARTTLLRDVTGAQYAPGRNGRSGHLLFVRDGKLIARSFDAAMVQFTGSEVTLAQDVAVTLGGGLADFSVSTNGVLAYRLVAPGPPKEMAWYDRTGTLVGTFGDRRGNPRNNIRISPTGKRVAFTRQGPSTPEVWVGDIASGYIQQLTRNGRSPVWSPDESEIGFIRQDDIATGGQLTYSVYRKRLDDGTEIKVWSRAGLFALNDWSGDGRQMLTTVAAPPGSASRIDVWLLPDIFTSATTLAVKLDMGNGHSQFVPSTQAPRWISGDGVLVRSLPGTKPGQWPVGDQASVARWRRDAKELFFHEGGSLRVAGRVDSATAFQFGPSRQLFPLPQGFRVAGGQWAPGWDVTPDGQRFLVTNPPPDTPTSIAIVTNWDVE